MIPVPRVTTDADDLVTAADREDRGDPLGKELKKIGSMRSSINSKSTSNLRPSVHTQDNSLVPSGAFAKKSSNTAAKTQRHIKASPSTKLFSVRSDASSVDFQEY